jgi:hypothetical protein
MRDDLQDDSNVGNGWFRYVNHGNSTGTMSIDLQDGTKFHVQLPHDESFNAACTNYTDFSEKEAQKDMSSESKKEAQFNYEENEDRWKSGQHFIPNPKSEFHSEDQVKYIYHQCRSIMMLPPTRIVEHMIHHGYNMLAFNLALRNHYSISANESFFEVLFGAFAYMLLFSAYLSVKWRKSQVQVRLIQFFRELHKKETLKEVTFGDVAKFTAPQDDGIMQLDDFYVALRLVKERAQFNEFKWKWEDDELNWFDIKPRTDKDFPSFSLSVLQNVLSVKTADGRIGSHKEQETRLRKIQIALSASNSQVIEHEIKEKEEPGSNKEWFEELKVLFPKRGYLSAFFSDPGDAWLGILLWTGHAAMGFLVRHFQHKNWKITEGFAQSLFFQSALWLGLQRCFVVGAHQMYVWAREKPPGNGGVRCNLPLSWR